MSSVEDEKTKESLEKQVKDALETSDVEQEPDRVIEHRIIVEDKREPEKTRDDKAELEREALELFWSKNLRFFLRQIL